MDISCLQWELRDASCLFKLQLADDFAEHFLILQPKLTRLETLKSRDWEYTYEHAEQLLYIQSLESLQVCHLPNCVSSFRIERDYQCCTSTWFTESADALAHLFNSVLA